jgi:hypothetical protein
MSENTEAVSLGVSAVSASASASSDAIVSSSASMFPNASVASELSTGSAALVDPQMASQCLCVLENFAARKKDWHIFYPNGYNKFKDKAAVMAQRLQSMDCSLETAQRFSVLLLYDLVLLLGKLTFFARGAV